VYADLTKHLLAGGEKEVEISALGEIIADAVNVVEMLKNQELVTVSKIETSLGEATSARNPKSAKIAIWVSAAPGFKAKYDKQMAERKAQE
jgi:DNA-binding protein